MFLHRFRLHLQNTSTGGTKKKMLTCLQWKIDVIQSLWQDTRVKKPYNILSNKYLQDKILLPKQNHHTL